MSAALASAVVAGVALLGIATGSPGAAAADLHVGAQSAHHGSGLGEVPPDQDCSQADLDDAAVQCTVSGHVWISTGFMHSNTQSISCPLNKKHIYQNADWGVDTTLPGSKYSDAAIGAFGSSSITVTDWSTTHGTPHRQAFTPWILCDQQR